jgi:hypothetical protein
MSRRRRVPGVTTYRRGNKWAYMVEGPRDSLTASGSGSTKAAFASEDDAWCEALEAKRRYDTADSKGLTASRVRWRVWVWWPALTRW